MALSGLGPPPHEHPPLIALQCQSWHGPAPPTPSRVVWAAVVSKPWGLTVTLLCLQLCKGLWTAKAEEGAHTHTHPPTHTHTHIPRHQRETRGVQAGWDG